MDPLTLILIHMYKVNKYAVMYFSGNRDSKRQLFINPNFTLKPIFSNSKSQQEKTQLDMKHHVACTYFTK